MALKVSIPGAIPALKAMYDASGASRRKVTVSYEDLLDVFRNLDLSGRKIAQRFDVTVQYIAFLYRTYFEGVLDFTFAERERFCLGMKDAPSRKLWPLVTTPRLVDPVERTGVVDVPGKPGRPSELDGLRKMVADQAEAAGRKVEAVVRRSARKRIPCVNSLLVDGRLCQLYFCRSAAKTSASSRLYYRFAIQVPQPWPFDACIFTVADPAFPFRIFVVPRSVLETLFRGVHRTSAYIPMHDGLPVYHNIRPRVSWCQYENAWHLLQSQAA